RTHIALVPGNRMGIAILTNLHATRMNLALSNLIMDQLFALPYSDWNAYYQAQAKGFEDAEKAQRRERRTNRKPDTKPSHPLQAYVGDYADPAYGTAQVRLEKGELVWRWSSFRASLEHYHYDAFIVREDVIREPLAEFTLGVDGSVAALRVFDVEFK